MKSNKPLILSLFAITIFTRCQKQVSIESTNEIIEDEVIAWLSKQKPSAQPVKSANVELLIENLDFNNATSEESYNHERLIIIPLKEKFKKVKKIQKGWIPVVLLKMTAAKTIREANLVLFVPAREQLIIPKNTFYNIFNTAHPQCDGTFKFLSVTGTRRYELSYDKGCLSRIAEIKKKDIDGKTSSAQGCIDWYLVTTIHWPDGSTSQTEEFLGTTCTGCDSCGDLECLCPDNDPGGNPGYYEYEEERICRGDYTNTAYEIPASLGSGSLRYIQALTGKFYRVHFERDYITSCYLVRSEIFGNSQGADCSAADYQKTGIGTRSITATATGVITWPGQSSQTITKTWTIEMGSVGWNCN